MKPGPKNKSGCPSDLHLRLPDDVRDLVNSLGPGRYQDHIIESIRRCARKKIGRSSIEIQSEIFKLKQDHRRIYEKIEELWDELQISENLTLEDLEKIQNKMKAEIDTWWKGIQ